MSGLHRSSSVPMRTVPPPQELLDDLCSRFVLNVPKEDLQSFERILFLVEQAHWFYEDNSVEQNPTLKSLSLREFAALMFNSCAALRPYIAHIDDIYKDFTSYKVRVPVAGAIILDESYERCLLVKGWKAGASWSFPRGKKNKDEEDHSCAIREVLEETGCDISKYLKKDDFIEVVVGQQRVRMYIIYGVKDDTVFAPQTKKEISAHRVYTWTHGICYGIQKLPSILCDNISMLDVPCLGEPLVRCMRLFFKEISWHRIDEIEPVGTEPISRGINGLKLYMVAPFLTSLKEWIVSHQPLARQNFDTHLRGMYVWKAKNNSTGATEISSTKCISVEPSQVDTGPGKSFRNFRFDTVRIFHVMESVFSANQSSPIQI